jgi:hypothetical protein
MNNEALTKPVLSSPEETVHQGASDVTLWLFLGGVTFLLLVLILFIFAAS